METDGYGRQRYIFGGMEAHIRSNVQGMHAPLQYTMSHCTMCTHNTYLLQSVNIHTANTKHCTTYTHNTHITHCRVECALTMVCRSVACDSAARARLLRSCRQRACSAVWRRMKCCSTCPISRKSCSFKAARPSSDTVYMGQQGKYSEQIYTPLPYNNLLSITG